MEKGRVVNEEVLSTDESTGHSPEENKTLTPRPSSDPSDPLNWPLHLKVRKTYLALLTVKFNLPRQWTADRNPPPSFLPRSSRKS